jgi:hypothetical protein
MQVTILERNISNATARIKFEHNNVTHISTYNLDMVIPGTDLHFKKQGIPFDEAQQQTIIDKLTAQIQKEIEAGIIVNKI